MSLVGLGNTRILTDYAPESRWTPAGLAKLIVIPSIPLKQCWREVLWQEWRLGRELPPSAGDGSWVHGVQAEILWLLLAAIILVHEEL